MEEIALLKAHLQLTYLGPQHGHSSPSYRPKTCLQFRGCLAIILPGVAAEDYSSNLGRQRGLFLILSGE